MREYCFIWIPFLTLICTQILKFIIESSASKRLEWSRLFSGSGGMPSSHTAFTFSLTTAIGLQEGFTSPIFAVALVFSFVVAYDAMGLRMESGKQATAINQIIEELVSKDSKSGYKKLKEELGHNPIQVLAGALFGIAFASLLIYFM